MEKDGIAVTGIVQKHAGRWIGGMAGLVLLVAGPLAAQTPPPTPATESIELSATADTWVDAGDPGAARGGESELLARSDAQGGSRLLIAFDFDSITGRVIKAELRLRMIRSTGQPSVRLASSGLRRPWDEMAATWEDQPPRTRSYDVIEVSETPGTVTWDLTALLQDTLEAGGSPLEGVAISGPLVDVAEPYERWFAARESGAGPRMVIEYEPRALEEQPDQDGLVPPGAGPVRVALAALVVAALLIVAVLALIRRRRAAP